MEAAESGMAGEQRVRDGEDGGGEAGSAKEERPGRKTNPATYGMYIGVFGGLIWGGLHLLYYGLHFTKTVPGFLLEPFFKHSFIYSWYGLLAGYGAFVAFTIVAALLYVLLFRKLKGPWPGLAYGAFWWTVLYVAVGPPSGMMPGLRLLGWNTAISDICLFLLWGLFIGYSIAMEFTDERVRERKMTADNAAATGGDTDNAEN